MRNRTVLLIAAAIIIAGPASSQALAGPFARPAPFETMRIVPVGWGFYPRAVPLYLYPISNKSLTGQWKGQAQSEFRSSRGKQEASLKPICRPWPPYGMLCTADAGTEKNAPIRLAGITATGLD
jgi:hypothetical protein